MIVNPLVFFLARWAFTWALFALLPCSIAFGQQNDPFGVENGQAPPVWSEIVTHEKRAKTQKLPPADPSKQWIFDQSLYTNSPSSGRRVWQYEHQTPALRDPNAFYDSPHESYPFSPAPYGPYPRFAPPRYYGASVHDQYYCPYRPYPSYGVDLYGP